MPEIPRKPAPLYPVFIAFAGVFALIYFFCLLMPTASDDFAFRDSMHSFVDIFSIAYDKYMHWDGRALGFLINHSLIYMPAPLSSAVQAAVFCLLLIALHIFVHAQQWRAQLNARAVLFLAVLLWAGIPAFGAVLFWKTAVGITLLSAFFLLFLLPVRFAFAIGDAHPLPQEHVSVVRLIVYGVSAFVLGAMDYSVPTAFAGLILCIWLYCRYIRHDHSELLRLFAVATLGLILGAMVALLAPGNFARAAANPDFMAFLQMPLGDKIAQYLAKLDYIHSWFLIPYFILGWSLYVLLRTYGKKCWRHFPFWGVAVFCIGQAAIASFIFAPVSPKRTFTSIFVLTLAAALLFLQQALPHAGGGARKTLTVFKALLVCYCLLSVPYEMGVFVRADGVSQQRLAILNSGEGQCLPPYTMPADRFLPMGEDIHDVALEPDFWLNKDLARIWKLDTVTLCRTPDRLFVSEEPHTGLAASLSAEGHMRLNLTGTTTPPQGGSLEVYYPAKLYDLMNPNPLFVYAFEHMAGAPALRDWLVPLFFKRSRLDVHTESLEDGSTMLTANRKWEHILPDSMHFYVLLPDKDGTKRLVRLTEIGATKNPS